MYGCMERALSGLWFDQVSTQLLNRMIRQVKPNDWLLYVCLLVPIADGNEVIGDLYTVFYDKEKGIITDPSVLFPDAPKLNKGNNRE